MAARHVLMKQNFVTGALYLGWALKEEIRHRQAVEEIIDFLEMAPMRNESSAYCLTGCKKELSWEEH